MDEPASTLQQKLVFAAQFLSVLLIWVFVFAIAAWIVNLIILSIELNDVPGASVAISIVAIPVFVVLAGVLTYVFIGLQKENHRIPDTSEEE
jgi:uncharacterized membrane protein YeiH